MTWLNYKKNKRWTTRVLYDFYSTLTRDLLLTEQIPNTIVALRLLAKDITSSNLLMIFSHVPTKTTKKLFLNGPKGDASHLSRICPMGLPLYDRENG